MSLQLLAQGTSASALQQAASLEAALPEQTACALTVHFRVRPPGFESAGAALQSLMAQTGIQSPAVAVDPSAPTMTVAWVKAKTALPLIAGVLLGGGALVAVLGGLEIDPAILVAVAILAVILLVGWEFYRHIVSPVVHGLSTFWNVGKPYIIVGGVAVLTLYAVGEAADALPYQISIRKHLEASYSAYHARGERAREDRRRRS